MKHENTHKEPSPSAENPPALQPFSIPCRYLRAKEMYYQGGEDDAYASGVYWCGKTQESFGPDGGSCDRETCGSGRSCYLL